MKWVLKYCIYIVSLSSFSIVAKAQSNNQLNCGLKSTYTKEEKARTAAQFQRWQSSKRTKNRREAATQYTIPVVFHVIELSPGPSDGQIAQAVNRLNDAFAHTGQFSGGSLGVDTEIEFCLASKAPDGSLTNGINRITSDYEKFDMDLEDAKLKNHLQWDPRHYLNIWLVDHIYSEIMASYTGRTWWTRIGAGGYATLPSGITPLDHFTDGIVVSSLTPTLLAHECGHYLGLLHTFEGGCTNNDCQLDGDMICDTPPDKDALTPCGDNSCNTDTLSNYSNNNFFEDVPDMGSNFMDYTSCANDFSAGQRDRMHFVLEELRDELSVESGNDACTIPCNSAISATFDQDIQRPVPGDTVTFSSTTQGTNTFEWYIELLGPYDTQYSVVMPTGYIPDGPVTATSPDLEHIFPETGKYRVYLKTWNNAEPNCFTSHSKIVVVGCGVDARYWPDKRVIASKRPEARMLDSVTFTNISKGASIYEWTVKHNNPNPEEPDLPDFVSDDEHLTYLFLEPGMYEISLKATEGTCDDFANTFFLPVLDPTIDGEPVIEGIECYREDSIQVDFKIHNYGYDTVNVGTPVAFYNNDPTQSGSGANLLAIFPLEEIVYGFDSAAFSAFLPNPSGEIEELFLMFNDPGTTGIPVQFPPSDGNVMSFNTIYPASGYPEMDYSNNLTSLEYDPEELSFLPDLWACEGEQIEVSIEDPWITAEWESAERGDLGTSSVLQYLVEKEDTITVRLESSLGCATVDEFLIHLSIPEIILNGEVFRIIKGQSVQLSASDGVSYAWSPESGLNDATIANPIASPDISTLYTVLMVDSIGCETSADVQVFVESSAYIPTLFTPNNDTRNDLLKIYGLQDVRDIVFKIYSRNGNVVYETNDPTQMTATGWDGTCRGNQLPTAVYYWKVSGTYNNGNPILLNGEEKGAVHLVR